jgi:hypothetical protein
MWREPDGQRSNSVECIRFALHSVRNYTRTQRNQEERKERGTIFARKSTIPTHWS